MIERIVCAANRYDDGTLLIGARHWDSHMGNQAKALREAYGKKEGAPEQGFIDQYGKFYTREEAWKVAEANGQIIRRCGGDTLNGGHLFSENLY